MENVKRSSQSFQSTNYELIMNPNINMININRNFSINFHKYTIKDSIENYRRKTNQVCLLNRKLKIYI